ncbi:hypothetical protein COL922a_011481 [Colletotrichum nupharicola]|nr:hypothetical protein COL922a_011481 [Colletotrichum nupharicola]
MVSVTLDRINDTIEKYKGVGKLKIYYEILEAASEDRFGGRLYTHHFSKDGTHDYYDVGAMRFPENDVMQRSFNLFNHLNFKRGALGERTNVTDWPVLIPYYLDDKDGVCPSYFNNIKKTGKSLTEAALEILDFEVPEAKASKSESPKNYWWCIDGGAQKIAETMRTTLKDPSVIKYNNQVVGMDADIQLEERVKKNMTLNLNNTVTGEALEAKSYFAVFNSTTLGAANRMDLSKAGLLWDTKQAIRCLNYGASCKVGIKFKTAWWRKAPLNIKKGGIARTDLPLQVCVYPSYNIDDDLDPLDKPAVLLVSYTWGQTAQRLATLIASKSPKKSNEEILKEEDELKNLLLRDLAYLHAEPTKDPKEEKKKFRKALDLITGEYLEHHAYDWYHDPHMAGAFAYFGPCQFSELYPAITRPNALGQLYFVGEASSAHHAWVVGALESVVRALWSMFNILHQSSRDSGEVYKPYGWAMQLLERGFFEDNEDPAYKEDQEETKKFYTSDNPEPSPFFPLPVEMPLRTDREAVEQDARRPDGPDGQSLLDHVDAKYPLMFGAACATLALLEYALDNWSGPGERREPVEPQPGNLGEGFPVDIEE